MTVENLFAKPTATGTCWGLIGGLSLIIATIFTTNGYLQVVPYFFILCAAILTTKYIDKSKVNFLDLFMSGFFAFIVSSLVLYAYIFTVVNPNPGITFIGHMWRFGVIVGLGIISSSIISFLAKPVR
jgi:hypothetical protein